MAATDPTPFNADTFATVNAAAPNRLTAVTYVGAVQNAGDTWFNFALQLRLRQFRVHPVLQRRPDLLIAAATIMGAAARAAAPRVSIPRGKIR